MAEIKDWQIQSAWWASGIFATGAVWYFLSRGDFFAAGVGAAAALCLAAVAIVLHVWKDRQAASTLAGLSDDTSESYVQRYRDEPSHIRFIRHLPRARRVAKGEAQEGWDTGVTLDMREASYTYIEFLKSVWLRLAEFYPANHFEGGSPSQYISDQIQRQYRYHSARHEPDGSGTGGTIVGVLTAGDVADDLEQMIEEAVESVFGYDENFDTGGWLADWRNDSLEEGS
ncbi:MULTISPECIES: hypothetical protein [Luteimonas]|uniref:hypothetical protein n=1 Tax=Luteimonas TaxID=83614 RepID=UPI0011803D40|nr:MULTISPECIES: hypothetical protein [Luteimonas]